MNSKVNSAAAPDSASDPAPLIRLSCSSLSCLASPDYPPDVWSQAQAALRLFHPGRLSLALCCVQFYRRSYCYRNKSIRS